MVMIKMGGTMQGLNEEAKKVHTIEIRMAKGNRKKDFTVLAMGYH